MRSGRVHTATTSDGVSLRGRVHGEGPSLVFWHGAYGDGDRDWAPMLPYLTGFTCHVPSWRGRGLSDAHRDLGWRRRVEDVLSYVDSVDEPVGLIGWSGGAPPALAAAAESTSVTGVALYEVTMGSLMDDDERAGFGGAVMQMAELAAEGRFADALRAAAAFPFNENELAAAEALGYFDATARYVPNLLDVFRQLRGGPPPTADDPGVLAAVGVPVLAMHGSETKPFWVRSARHVADHVPDAHVSRISGAGHFGPMTHPESVAATIVGFFTPDD